MALPYCPVVDTFLLAVLEHLALIPEELNILSLA